MHLHLTVRQPAGHAGVGGGGGISKHYIYMAFTSKIGASVVSWLPHRPSFRIIWKRFGQ